MVANLGRWHLTAHRRHRPARRAAAPAVKVRLLPERGLDVAEAFVGDRQIAWLSGRGDVAVERRLGRVVGRRPRHDMRARQRRPRLGGHRPPRHLQLARGARRRREDESPRHDRRPARPARRAHDRVGDGGLTLTDRTTNLAAVALEAPLLYHVNLGAGRSASRAMRRRSSRATTTRRRTTRRVSPAPRPTSPSACGSTSARRGRASSGERARARRSARACRACGSGSSPASARSAIEPANCSVLGRAHDRAEGRLPMLAPGETRETWLTISELSITAKETR